MINQQLIDFIKQQLQKGLTKEIISSQLLSNGWNTQDIEEGFKQIEQVIQVSSNLKPRKNKKLIIVSLIVLLFILAGGLFAYYYLNNSKISPVVKNTLSEEESTNQTENQDLNTTPQEETINTPEDTSTKSLETGTANTQIPTTPKTTNNTQKTTSQIINCGNDLNCFIKAANNCQESEVDIIKNNQNFYFGAVKIDTVTHYEIIGKEGNNCVSKNQITDFKYKLSEELKQEQTQEEIDYIEKEASKMFTETKYGYICKLDLSKKMGDILVRDLIKPTNLEWAMDISYGSELACEYIRS